jgi:hypothetical protein
MDLEFVNKKQKRKGILIEKRKWSESTTFVLYIFGLNFSFFLNWLQRGCVWLVACLSN